MVEQIFIRLQQDATVADWWVLDAQGHRRGGIGHAPLAEIAHHAPSRRIVAIVPSHRILFTQVRLPKRSRRQWAEALPFALEDQVAADVETLHFAGGDPDGDGSIPVAVVERSCLNGWLATFREAGLHPDLLWPDLFLLPWIPHTWSIVHSANFIGIRWQPFQGCVVADPLAPAIVERLYRDLAEADRPREIVFWGDPEDPAIRSLKAAVADEDCLWTVRDGLWYEDASRGPCTGLNLLQGPFAPNHLRQAVWERWKPAARLGAAALALALALLVIQRIRLGGVAHSWQTRVHQIFHAVLPGQPYVSPRAQIEQALRTRVGGPGGTVRFLALLARLSRNRPATIHVLSLSYGARAIRLHFTAPGMAEARLFEQSITRSNHWIRRHQKIRNLPGGVEIWVEYGPRQASL